MYKQEFENLLRTGREPRALLLYGENGYLIESYIQYYIDKTGTTNLLMRQYFDEYNFENAKKYLSQSSLFGGTNLLIIRRDKKIPKKELDTLIDIAKRGRENYFILDFRGLLRDAKEMEKSFSPKKDANWVRLFEPTFRENIISLQRRARNISLDIDYFALEHLILLLNNNLLLCAKELEKLAILEVKITTEDIDRLVYSTTPLALEQLLFDLFEKKPIIEKLAKRLEMGEDEFSILRATQLFVSQIHLFQLYKKINGALNPQAVLGYRLPKHIERRKTNLTSKIKTEQILKILEYLLQVEIEMKKTLSNRETILYSAFIELQKFL